MPWRLLVAALVGAVFAAGVASGQDAVTPTSLPQSDAPPWAKGPAPRRLPVQELAGPRQFLELLHIDSSQLDRFRDGRPLHPDEYEPLYRILYRIPRFGRDDLARWRLQDVDWEQFAERPEDYRASSLRLTGQVTRIEKEELLPEVARLLEFNHFYRVELQPDNAPFPALVFSRWLPRAWKVGEPVSYRGSAEGLLLKLGATDDGQPRLLVVCDRMAWRPSAPDPELGVAEDHVLLAAHGLDLGQFDRVLDRRGITALERECFYQMLNAARRIDMNTLRAHAAESDLASMLQKPRALRGKAMTLTGQVKRVQEIRVEERDIRQLYGISRYYEVDVFVPLEDQAIKMGESEDAPVFANYYPVIFCLAELPRGFTAEELVDREVRIPAFYFKLWEYETEFMRRHGDRPTQLSPMLIGRAPEVLPRPARTLGTFGVVVAGAFVAALAFAWIWVWRSNRRDAAFERQLRRRRHHVDDGDALKELKADDGPDFSNL